MILPRILFLSRIIYPKRRHIKRITRIVFNFLWNYEKFEPIERETLYRQPKHGGIGFLCIQEKINTAYMWQFILVLTTESTNPPFWNQYAKYNLGSKLIPFDPSQFSNSMPHRPLPNQDWKIMLQLIKSKNLNPSNLTNTNFKQLYLQLLNLPPILTQNINASVVPHSWLRIALHLPKTTFFSKCDKELAYRTAHKGFLWGSFKQEKIISHSIHSQQTKITHLCKLCLPGKDHPHHLFYECTKTRQILST